MKSDHEQDAASHRKRDELDLLIHWQRPEPRRTFQSIALSALAHVVGVGVVALVGLGTPAPIELSATRTPIDEREAVTLITPRDIVTQKQTNVAKPPEEVDLAGLVSPPEPRPAIAPTFRPPSAPKGAPAQSPQIQAAPEAPKIESAPQIAQAPPPAFGNLPGAPPPVQPLPPKVQQEKPKLAFESIGANSGTPRQSGMVVAPKSSLEETVRSAMKPGSGGVTVGDAGDSGVQGVPNLSTKPGRQSTLELMSDPQGVDFRPYLARVLAAVRRNWFTVMPESVRLGQRGRTTIQFSISREGGVPKLVIASPSGSDSLDRAAVAGISASNPFPPLPPEFKGNQIQLQLSFAYNMPGK